MKVKKVFVNIIYIMFSYRTILTINFWNIFINFQKKKYDFFLLVIFE